MPIQTGQGQLVAVDIVKGAPVAGATLRSLFGKSISRGVIAPGICEVSDAPPEETVQSQSRVTRNTHSIDLSAWGSVLLELSFYSQKRASDKLFRADQNGLLRLSERSSNFSTPEFRQNLNDP
jgi:hypothetical protein